MSFGISEFTDWSVDRKTMAIGDGSKTLKPPRITLNAIKRTNATFGDSEVIIED